jgi:zinc transport system substrate-binding protein
MLILSTRTQAVKLEDTAAVPGKDPDGRNQAHLKRKLAGRKTTGRRTGHGRNSICGITIMSDEPRAIVSSFHPWRFVIGLAAVVLVASFLPSSFRTSTRQDGELNVICTFLPVYVFTLNVVGDTPGVRVELMVPPSLGCPHEYSLRTSDLRRLAGADIVIANGLGIDDMLLARHRTDARFLTISDDCELIHREHGDHHDHDHGHGHAHGCINPHVWAAPSQAIRQVRTLVRELGEIDPDNAARYEANGTEYISRLEQLLERMQAAAAGFAHREVVTSHDAFDYLARDLGLTVVTTLGDDPDHSPSAARMARVVQTIRERQVAAIFFEPAYSDRLARAISRETGVPVWPLNPFNSFDGPPGAGSYEEVMEENLEVLKRALGERP